MKRSTERLYSHQAEINALCRKHRVSRMFAFGSVLTDQFTQDSDVDLLVSFDEMPHEEYADNYFDLKNSLQFTLGRSVDLVEDKSVSNPYFRKNIDMTKMLIYG